MQSQIEKLKSAMIAELHQSKNDQDIKQVEIKYFGKKGLFGDIMKSLKDLSNEEKQTIGKLANVSKKELENEIKNRYVQIENEQLATIADEEWIDVTVPGKQPSKGHRHLISKFIDEIETVFARMGFVMAEGPEIEKEYYNFDQLNIPETHPARDMHDTFWIKNLNQYVLRTHTSPVQIHHMEANKPPIRVIAPGRTFRKDSDATHSPMFHQVEGLMVDENISMANLKAVMTEALQQIFEDSSIQTRFRVSFFPFVEPGMEIDCTCPICKGSGKDNHAPCRLCKQCGWLEIGGAGMVHPNVLENAGVDSKKYSGFAFGMGLDRMIMIKYRINHLRLFFENDLRFIEQF